MKKLLLSLTIVFASAAASFGQTADEIISKAIDARGGAAKLNALKSMRMESTTSVMGMDLASKSVIVHKRGMRNNIEVMGQSIVVAIDGDKGWTINPLQGSDPVALPDEQVKATASQLDLSGMANIKESGAVEVGEMACGVQNKNKIGRIVDDEPVQALGGYQMVAHQPPGSRLLQGATGLGDAVQQVLGAKGLAQIINSALTQGGGGFRH